MKRSVLLCSVVLLLLGAVVVGCSDEDGAPADVVTVLDDHGDLAAWTVELVDGELPAATEARAEVIGRAISAVADGQPPSGAAPRARLAGEVLGATSEVLAGIDERGGDADRRASLEYALTLAAAASDSRGLDENARLEWIAPASLEDHLRDQVGAGLDDRDFEEIARRLVDETELTGAAVIDEVIGELSGTVTAESGNDQLTTFLQAVSRGRSSV